VVRSIDAIKEETRQIRLKLGKAVKDQKESRKLEILQTAQQDYDTFQRGIDVGQYMPPFIPDFAGAMKGKRTISSLKDACDDLMAQSKIEANDLAGIVRGNLRHLQDDASDYRFLFNDFGQLCQKSADDFAAIVKSRIADHKQAEHDRLEAERAKIRAEEEAKVRHAAEQAERQAAREEMEKAEQARREQYDKGQKAAQEAPKATAKPSIIKPGKGAHPERPSTDEIIEVLAAHYGVENGVVALWIHELKIQEAA